MVAPSLKAKIIEEKQKVSLHNHPDAYMKPAKVASFKEFYANAQSSISTNVI